MEQLELLNCRNDPDQAHRIFVNGGSFSGSGRFMGRRENHDPVFRRVGVHGGLLQRASSKRWRMHEPTWNRAEQSQPWPWVAVMTKLRDGRSMLAVWTGHLWWGDSRELAVQEWMPADPTALLSVPA